MGLNTLRPHLAWRTLPRDTRDTFFLLLIIGWIVLLQMPQVPLWCTALSLATLLWRAVLAWQQRALPSWPWRLGWLALAVGATWWTYRNLLGQDAGITLIVLLLALKTLELRARRDAFVVFFLGFFTLLTLLLHSQSLLTALGISVALLGLLSALINAHLPVGRPSLWHSTRLAARMLLLGAPLMLVLFLLFPRFGPLWNLPDDGSSGRSGLSDHMQVGAIARLALDPSVAFRVEFLDGRIPPMDSLYFRGPVFDDFDGTTWRTRSAHTEAPAEATWRTRGAALRYRLTLEPGPHPWLITLEATPQLPAIMGQAARLGPHLTWTANHPLTEVTRFDARAYLQHEQGPLHITPALHADTALPSGSNPRTRQLAQELQRALGPTANTTAYVQAVLHRLQTGGYRYTLEPGVFGLHSADEFWFDRRAGFCEHIASSFVILMRALDIPARVVTGYQGGELNPLDGVWTVRQSDAHAWAEVWHAGRGWVRIDPTAYVMPERTVTTQRLRPPPGLIAETMVRVHPALLTQLRSLWDASNHRWNQWVINYTQSQQLDLLRWLGISQPNGWHVLPTMTALLGLLALVVAAALLWQRRPADPWLRLMAQTRRMLVAQGWPISPHATPRHMALYLAPHAESDPASHAMWQAWLLAMERWRYDPTHRTPTLAQLRTQWHQLPRLFPPQPRP